MDKHYETRGSKPSPKLLVGIILAILFGIALYLRIYLPYDQVFSGEWIKFTGVDAYYHMHLVDNLVHNFPHLTGFNPYGLYPGGAGVGSTWFFDWLLASIIWVIGLGSPTQHTVDVVGVYFPAVLGALTVIPVYFIGKELFNRWAGVISAGLIAILPGEFLGRSILGFTDQHVAEVLFTTVTILFLILAIKAARQRQLTFSHLKRRDWATSAKPITYSLLAGISLGIYLHTWLGALLFVFIIFIYFIIQFIIDHLKHKSTDYLCLISVPIFFIALVMFLPISPGKFYLASMIIALVTPLALSGISQLMASKEVRPAYYPLTLVGLGLAGWGLFRLVNPSLLSSMLGKFSIFAPRGVQLTTIEMQPLLPAGVSFLNTPAWGNFTTGFILSFISLGILIYLVIKRGGAEKTLLIVWSLIILVAALGQCRFAYYLAVNVALLTGYLSWLILGLAGFKEVAVKPVEIPKEVEKGKVKLKRREGGFHVTTRQINMALAVVGVFFLVFFPNIKPAIATAKAARFAPSNAWCSSLSWLKENTPDPFGDPDFYYELHQSPQPGESYNYPESAYGVTAWWDYGYWITRIGHRIPNANPAQKPAAITNVAGFFLSQDEDSANEIIQELGSSYVIIDYEIALVSFTGGVVRGKFYAVAMWAGSSYQEFFDVYHIPQEDKLVPKLLFYPEYYRSLSIRLYNFDGKAVAPESSLVISYQERVRQDGKLYKEITSAEEFDSYEEAEAYVSSQESDNYRIVGTNQFISPVPLEALKHYRLVYSPDSYVTQAGIGMVPAVKIFEYITLNTKH